MKREVSSELEDVELVGGPYCGDMIKVPRGALKWSIRARSRSFTQTPDLLTYSKDGWNGGRLTFMLRKRRAGG